eukprot:GFUD01058940.1.p1 GENE.GFUD01058940.1~~GFUD01058940.1.p1  ORF type:complete len:216 (+),score=50.01 GFUD01058940.1:77-724(+)
MKAPVIFSLLLSLSSCFDFPSDSSVCSSNQECKLPKDCPQVVKDFKEKKIQPTICNFLARSLSVCCDSVKSTKPVKTLPADPVSLTCGKKNSKTVFQFQLGARQGNLAELLDDPPVSIPKSFRNELHVVGGNEVKENAYPWMAALGSRTKDQADDGIRWFCGGSLISSKMILTAAHCIQEPGSELSLDIVRLGVHNLGDSAFENVDDYVPKQLPV